MKNTFFETLWPTRPDAYLATWTKALNRTAFFHTSDIEAAEAYMTSAAKTDDVYFGMGLLKEPPQRGRGRSSDVAYISAFHADFDIAPDGANVHAQSALPRSPDDLIAFLTEAQIPQPTMMVNSGNGIHAYWVMDEPQCLADPSDREQAGKLLQDFQKSVIGLARQKRGWKFDSTADLARVLRWPGTFNHKTNPPKLVEIIHHVH